MSTVRVGTRGSALALTQTGTIARDVARLAGLEDDQVELVRIRTDGDRLTGSLAALGGAGVFVAALREAVLDGRCDLAVHSLKDLPTASAPGLVVAAIPERADPRDALCARDGLRLADLPAGAKVGTGSPRRAAQLRALRPDLDVVDIRGNVDTRIGRVAGLGDGRGDLDAVVLAAAGLARIGRLDVVSELLDPALVAPAPGQGALAVETRADGGPVPGALVALDHLPTRLAVTAERAVLNRLEAGCAAPVGALAHLLPPATPGAPLAPTSDRAPTLASDPGASQREESLSESAGNPSRRAADDGDTASGAGGGGAAEGTGGVGGAAGAAGGVLRLDAVVCATDGSARLGVSGSIVVPSDRDAALAEAEALGVRIADQLLADGAADLAPLGELTTSQAATAPTLTGPMPTSPAPTTPTPTGPTLTDPTGISHPEPARGTTGTAPTGALAGWRVLVPRGGAWGARVAGLLSAHGARPTVVPLIEFAPPQDPTPTVSALTALGRGDYDWVTITSPRTVEFLAASAAAAPTLAGLLTGTRVAAVGTQTADALRDVAVAVDLLPTGEHSARGIVADFPRPEPYTAATPFTASTNRGTDQSTDQPTHLSTDRPPRRAPDRSTGRVLVPHSDLADSTLADGLRALGWEVDEVVVYRTVPGPTPAPGLDDDVRSGAFDAVLLTSGSTVTNLMDLLGTPASSTAVCALGPHTARVAREHGLAVTVVAEATSADALVEALAEHARTAPGRSTRSIPHTRTAEEHP